MGRITLDLSTSYPPIDYNKSKTPLLAVRFFDLVSPTLGGDIFLGSVARSYIYEGPINRNNRAPVIMDGAVRHQIDPNALGFYSLKVRDAGGMIEAYLRKPWALISLFGTVLEHTKGYRSQNVRIDKIILAQAETHEVQYRDGDRDNERHWWRSNPATPRSHSEVVESLERIYQVEVVTCASTDIYEELKRAYANSKAST